MHKIKFILIVSILFSCNGNKTETLDNADWLIGTWKGTTKNNTVFFENWQRVDDSTFINTNYRLQDADTIIGGKSKIFIRSGSVFYSNGMSGEKEKTWRAKKYLPTEIVFENGALTKLQTIKFELTNDNKWHAMLFGSKDTIGYLMERVN